MGSKEQYRAVRDCVIWKGTREIMARTVRESIGQHRTVACGIGQQKYLLEQFRRIKNSTEQLGAVSCEKEKQK